MGNILEQNWMSWLWLLAAGCILRHNYVLYQTDPRFHYLREMLGAPLSVSRATAAVINVNALLLVISMCRGVLVRVSRATELLSSYSLMRAFLYRFLTPARKFHVFLAQTMIMAAAVHTGFHFMNAVNFSRNYNTDFPELNMASYKGENPFKMVATSIVGITGLLMVFILIILALTSLQFFRRRSYEVFSFSHYCAHIFLLLLVLHPLSGVLKQVENSESHQPGCQIDSITYAKSGGHEIHGKGIQLERKDYFKVNKSSSFNEIGTKLEASKRGNFILALEARNKLHSSESLLFDATKNSTSLRCEQRPVFRSIHSETWLWVSSAYAFMLIEFITRCATMCTPAQVVSAKHYHCQIFELQLRKKALSFSPGQFVYLKCSQVSRFQWHPFTVAMYSPCTPGLFTVFIKMAGDWSKKLGTTLEENKVSVENSDLTDGHTVLNIAGNSEVDSHAVASRNKGMHNGRELIQIFVDGPFDSSSSSMQLYSVLIGIAGGIGITPLASLMTYLIHHPCGWPLRIHIVWVSRSAGTFYILAPLLVSLLHTCWQNQMEDKLEIRLHVTRETFKGAKTLEEFPCLTPRLLLGRPVWKHLFNSWRESYHNKHVGVFACGPKRLCHQLRRESRKASAFFYHQECF